jgi:uncharacterized membrane protein
MFKFATRTFFKGLVVVLPILAAAYIVVWIVGDGEAAVRGLLLKVVPEYYYVPGVGLALLLAGIFGIGLLMYPWLTRKLIGGIDHVLRRIPLFGTVYGPARDLMDVLGGDVDQKLGQVVLIKVPNTNMETLGFVTREDLSGLPEGFAKENHVVVYVQWSSQVGGYCFVVPREAIRPVDMTVEEGMRWALTAGISGPVSQGKAPEQVDEQTGRG